METREKKLVRLKKLEAKIEKQRRGMKLLSKLKDVYLKNAFFKQKLETISAMENFYESKKDNLYLRLDNSKKDELISLYKENNLLKIVKQRYITVKEFKIMFGDSIDTQEVFRTRVDDPIPYIQVNEGGKIKYDLQKVTKWMERYEKNV